MCVRRGRKGKKKSRPFGEDEKKKIDGCLGDTLVPLVLPRESGVKT